MVFIRTAAEAEVLQELRGEKSLEWLLATGGQEQTKDLDREAVRDSGPASLCICSHSVFLVFLISSLSPSQWLLIPRVWALPYVTKIPWLPLLCPMTIVWPGGTEKQLWFWPTATLLGNILFMRCLLWCLVCQAARAISVRYVTWDMFASQDCIAQAWS